MPNVPEAPAIAHEVRLVRQAYARRYAEARLAGADTVLDFGAPEPGFVWKVERIAIHASAAPTAVDFFTGSLLPSAYVGSIVAAARVSQGFDPPLHVSQRDELLGLLAGFAAADVSASAQLVICRLETIRTELPENSYKVLCAIRDAITVSE